MIIHVAKELHALALLENFGAKPRELLGTLRFVTSAAIEPRSVSLVVVSRFEAA